MLPTSARQEATLPTQRRPSLPTMPWGDLKRLMDRWMDGWEGGLMDTWMDGWMERHSDFVSNSFRIRFVCSFCGFVLNSFRLRFGFVSTSFRRFVPTSFRIRFDITPTSCSDFVFFVSFRFRFSLFYPHEFTAVIRLAIYPIQYTRPFFLFDGAPRIMCPGTLIR